MHKKRGVADLFGFQISLPVAGGSGFLGGDGILQALKNSAAPGNSQLSNLGAGAYGVPNQTMQGGTLGQMGLQVRFWSSLAHVVSWPLYW